MPQSDGCTLRSEKKQLRIKSAPREHTPSPAVPENRSGCTSETCGSVCSPPGPPSGCGDLAAQACSPHDTEPPSILSTQQGHRSSDIPVCITSSEMRGFCHHWVLPINGNKELSEEAIPRSPALSLFQATSHQLPITQPRSLPDRSQDVNQFLLGSFTGT